MNRGLPGKVYLVGAGPGDPGLITVKGLRVLRRADVVAYDRLVHPLLLQEAPPQAERIAVHRWPYLSQEAICALLVQRARAGQTVVRLKGGDPFVFGRGGEELSALRQADVPVEVIPGVTAAVAVPASEGIPVTHRRLAWGFAVVTGQRAQGEGQPDWEALARIPTLVVLMGLGSLEEVTAALIRHGASPATPAAAISMGTTPLQRRVVATLATLAACVREAGLEPPCTVIVGEVVRLAGGAGHSQVDGEKAVEGLAVLDGVCAGNGRNSAASRRIYVRDAHGDYT